MNRMSDRQVEVAERLDSEVSQSRWRSWKWQLQHAITDIETFQMLTGIRFTNEERRDLELTLAKFPLSVTPY